MNEQREIKFRAWDTEERKMYYSPDIRDWDGFHAFLMTDCEDNDLDGTIIIMQYTGLKDKNGKEIYESDIIKSDYPWMCGVVEFGEGFQGEPADGQYPYQGWHVDTQAFAEEDVSVIGNIYENPELLSGKAEK